MPHRPPHAEEELATLKSVSDAAKSISRLKREGTNFYQWADEFEVLINNIIKKPFYFSNPSEMDSSEDLVVQEFMRATIDREVWRDVCSCETSVLMFEKLSKLFNKHNRSDHLELLRSILQRNWEPGSSVSLKIHAHRVFNLGKDLERAGFPFTFNSVMGALFKLSLPSDEKDLFPKLNREFDSSRGRKIQESALLEELFRTLETKGVNKISGTGLDENSATFTASYDSAQSSVSSYVNSSPQSERALFRKTDLASSDGKDSLRFHGNLDLSKRKVSPPRLSSDFTFSDSLLFKPITRTRSAVSLGFRKTGDSQSSLDEKNSSYSSSHSPSNKISQVFPSARNYSKDDLLLRFKPFVRTSNIACFHCKKTGHWQDSCDDLKNGIPPAPLPSAVISHVSFNH